MKLILKGLGDTIAILVGAFIFAIIVLAAKSNQDLITCTFWRGLFLGILAVLTDEMQKQGAPIFQQSHEQTTVTSYPNAPVMTQYIPSAFQVCTKPS